MIRLEIRTSKSHPVDDYKLDAFGVLCISSETSSSTLATATPERGGRETPERQSGRQLHELAGPVARSPASQNKSSYSSVATSGGMKTISTAILISSPQFMSPGAKSALHTLHGVKKWHTHTHAILCQKIS